MTDPTATDWPDWRPPIDPAKPVGVAAVIAARASAVREGRTAAEYRGQFGGIDFPDAQALPLNPDGSFVSFVPTAAMSWENHQDWEAAWWGDCVNTFGEEAKQLTYADRMGLVNTPRDGQWPVYDLGDRSVMDIGGGPTSILLKCVGSLGAPRRVFDPCPYPEWVGDRYKAAGVELVRMKGEDLIDVAVGSWDEVWIYNVLQHTDDPALIVAHACKIGKVVRLFEWIDTPPEPGHPHTLRADDLRRWLGGYGTVEILNGENGCSGPAFYGAFPQTHEEPPARFVARGTTSREPIPNLDAAITALRETYGAGAVMDAVILR